MRAAGPVHRLFVTCRGSGRGPRRCSWTDECTPRRDRRVRWRPRAAATLAQRCHGRSGRRPLATRARRLSPILWRSPHIRGSERAVSAFLRPDPHYPSPRIGRRASAAATATPERPCKRAERPRDAIVDSRPVIRRCDRSSPSWYTIMYCPPNERFQRSSLPRLLRRRSRGCAGFHKSQLGRIRKPRSCL